MLPENVTRVLSQIAAGDVVLDCGGWAKPFNRANHVIDVMPYETRGVFGSEGGDREQFSSETWIQRDLCARTPFPFGDKTVDFAICSHTLEDIRDPLFVCSELIRVARRGYIEVPSRVVESTVGVESPAYAGYCHHRWLVEMQGDRVEFRHKPHLLHADWRYHFPAKYHLRLLERERVSYLFWQDTFEYAEVTLLEYEPICAELAAFVGRHRARARRHYVAAAITYALRRKLLLPIYQPVLRRVKRILKSASGYNEWKRG